MSVTEKAAYLKGLAEGLSINTETAEGKLLLALVDAFEELADEVSDIDDTVAEYGELLDELDEDLGELEEDFYLFDEDDQEDLDDEEDDDFVQGALYEVTCENCGEIVYLDDAILKDGSMECPNCGKLLEFVYDEEEEESDDSDN